MKRTGRNQCWFPDDWTKEDVHRAGEHVLENTDFSSIPEGGAVYENYGGVRVGVNKTNGQPSSIFPDGSKQPPVSETPPIVKPNNKDDEY